MKRASLAGVGISQGPADWQIVQRRLDNAADIPLSGTWLAPEGRLGAVEVRLVDEGSQVPPAAHLDWAAADSNPDRTWRHVLENIPAGGPYRLETRLGTAGDSWRLAGDNIHHLGVGDLWIIAGDDDALGFGRGAADDPPETGAHLFRLNERWAPASHPLHDVTGLRDGRYFSSGAAGHSPWLAFARILRRETGLPVGLIPAASAGSALADWHSRKSGADCPAFANLLSLIRLASSWSDFSNFSLHDGAIQKVKRPESPPGTVAGCLWHQGAADCRREGSAKAYRELFAEFVGKLRAELAAPLLPLIVCQLNRAAGVAKAGESALWGLVREAQRAAGHDLERLAVVPTLDSGLSDGIHNSAAGNLVIGARAARAALGLAYGKPHSWRFPDFRDAWLEDGRRDRVSVAFARVSGALRPVTGEITSLGIADAQGGVPIRKLALASGDRILVQLNRELAEKPTVSFCASHCPDLAFVDDNGVPPLAFAKVAIRED